MEEHVPMVTSVIKNSEEKIEHYSLKIVYESVEENVIPPLKFMNVKYLQLHCLYVYILWSNKCQSLELSQVHYISKQWCDFVTNDCDCSNIKFLSFDMVTFCNDEFTNNNNNNNNCNGKKVLKQLATQFLNLKDLMIFYYYCANIYAPQLIKIM